MMMYHPYPLYPIVCPQGQKIQEFGRNVLN